MEEEKVSADGFWCMLVVGSQCLRDNYEACGVCMPGLLLC